MKKIMNAAATAICLFAMAWTAVSCSSDDNHQNSADQMLKNMLGSYEGTLGFSYSTSTVSGWTTSWKVDETRIITIDKFPYRTLANGVSKEGSTGTESPLHAALLKAQDAPLKVVIKGFGLSDSNASLTIIPQIKFNVTIDGDTYEMKGYITDNKPMFSSRYTMSNSEMVLEFTVEKLVKVNNAHGTSEVQKDFDRPVTYYLKANKK